MAGLKEIGMSREEANKQISNNLTLEQRMSNKEFDNCPADEVVIIGRLVSNSKITSRWLERWVANYCNAWTNPESTDGKDYGDLFFGNNVIGEDNVELKSCEKDFRHVIGGGQHRFFENIPFYMYLQFEQGGKNDNFTLYLLTKEQVHEEIFDHDVCRCSPSQVSGQTKIISEGKMKRMSNDEVRALVQNSFDGKNNILWGFGIDSNPGEFKKKLPVCPKNLDSKAGKQYQIKIQKYNEAKEAHQKKVDTLARWNNKYKIDIEELKDWKNVKTKYGI